jgi:NitT/TauT family transport system substrate-binding protein
VIAAACAAAVAVACSGSNPGAGERVRIAVGGQTQIVYLPVTLAEELGFYRAEGIDVELQDFDGGAKALQAVVGGSADVVCGYYDHTIQMAADGREFVAFVAMLRYPGLLLVTSPQSASAVQAVADLRGSVVGVTSPGSSSQMFLTFLLQRHQVPADTVSVTTIGGGATAIAGVESGRLAAAWMAEPAFTLVKRRHPEVRVLADLRTEEGTRQAFGVGRYPGAVLYTSGDWLRGHRDTAARLARAIVRTLEWMASHSEQEIADRTPKLIRGEDDALFREAMKSSRAMFSTDGEMSAEGAAAVRQMLATSMPKVRDATIDLARTYTNEFIAR